MEYLEAIEHYVGLVGWIVLGVVIGNFFRRWR